MYLTMKRTMQDILESIFYEKQRQEKGGAKESNLEMRVDKKQIKEVK